MVVLDFLTTTLTQYLLFIYLFIYLLVCAHPGTTLSRRRPRRRRKPSKPFAARASSSRSRAVHREAACRWALRSRRWDSETCSATPPRPSTTWRRCFISCASSTKPWWVGAPQMKQTRSCISSAGEWRPHQWRGGRTPPPLSTRESAYTADSPSCTPR